MQTASGMSEVLAIAMHSWTWLSAAMVLGILVGWATCGRAQGE